MTYKDFVIGKDDFLPKDIIGSVSDDTDDDVLHQWESDDESIDILDLAKPGGVAGGKS